MAKQRGLGRGFDALIPTEVTAGMPAVTAPASSDSEAVRQLELTVVVPNPHQPRHYFDDTELQELANSIRQHGVLQPIVVSDRGDGHYELIAGERRLRASKLANQPTIPALIRSLDEQQKLELAVIENVQRSQLNPLETAAAYRKLTDEFNLTLDQIGQRVGKAKSTVANLMRLLQLPPAARDALSRGQISEAHGRAILALEDPARQAELLRHITADSWTVRQAEEFARHAKPASNKPATGRPAAPPANTKLIQTLSDRLHTKVTIQPRAKGGRLVIDYADAADLERIAAIIKPEA